jgi:hypothetical protein
MGLSRLLACRANVRNFLEELFAGWLGKCLGGRVRLSQLRKRLIAAVDLAGLIHVALTSTMRLSDG